MQSLSLIVLFSRGYGTPIPDEMNRPQRNGTIIGYAVHKILSVYPTVPVYA
jgi:hypothetical protein